MTAILDRDGYPITVGCHVKYYLTCSPQRRDIYVVHPKEKIKEDETVHGRVVRIETNIWRHLIYCNWMSRKDFLAGKKATDRGFDMEIPTWMDSRDIYVVHPKEKIQIDKEYEGLYE